MCSTVRSFTRRKNIYDKRNFFSLFVVYPIETGKNIYNKHKFFDVLMVIYTQGEKKYLYAMQVFCPVKRLLYTG